MADYKVKIQGVPGLDGEYDLDLTFTHRDYRTIKQLSGVRALEVEDALKAGDMDVILAVAEIALQRAGVPHHVDQLWDAEGGSMQLIQEEIEEADASPPLQRPEPERPESEPEPEGQSKPSGPSMSTSMEPSQETAPQRDSGIQQQVSGSVRLTSTT